VQIPADGYSQTSLHVSSRSTPQLTLLQKNSGVTVGRWKQESREVWSTHIRAGVAPGPLTLHINAGSESAEASLELKPSFDDRDSDGLPDTVQLDTQPDKDAFRRWFTFLAEAQFFQRDELRPKEINDCAALIRYAYRESLRKHDSAWVAEAKLPLAIGLDPVTKYEYPFTLLRALLFRVKPGPLQPSDLDNGAFSQFADAHTLQTLNTHFVSRDLRRAVPGDLLFYRHESADLPFHAMIYLGHSQIQDDGQTYLLYHTGPDGTDPGEIRRPSVAGLSQHPNPSWRPQAGNPAFLGVYRWHILR